MCTKTNKQENKMNRKNNLHGKSGDASANLNFTCSESDPSDGYETHHLSNYSIFDDGMVYFDKKTVHFLQILHFHRNVLKSVFCCITIFYAKTSAMKNKVDETPSNPICSFSTSVPFKTLMTQHRDQFPLRHMKKKIWDPFKKETVHQFHFVYMTHNSLKKHRTHRDQVIKKINLHSN